MIVNLLYLQVPGFRDIYPIKDRESNHEIYDKINHLLKPQHFYDPVHQRIFEICAEKISRNSLASPVTLKTYFQDDPGILGSAVAT